MAKFTIRSNCARNANAGRPLMLVLPVVVSVLFLRLLLYIADPDSPRGGVIRVDLRNLIELADSTWPT